MQKAALKLIYLYIGMVEIAPKIAIPKEAF